MQDLLKDVFSWVQDRVRSPFYTYIAAAFIAINWREIAILVWSDGAIAERIKIFDGNTSFVALVFGPILLGVFLAILSPYLKYGGAWLAKYPRRILDGLQSDEAQARRIRDYELKTEEEVALAELEEAREQRKIDAAKRTAEAQVTGGDELVETLVKSREENQDEIGLKRDFKGRDINNGWENEILMEMSGPAIQLLDQLGGSTSGTLIFKQISGTGYYSMFSIDGVFMVNENSGKELSKIKHATEELEKLELIERSLGKYFLTPRGDAVYSFSRYNDYDEHDSETN